MDSASNENNSSINENDISTPFLPLRIPNSSIPIENDTSHLNAMSSASNTTRTQDINRTPSTPNSSIRIENNMSQSNWTRSLPNATDGSAHSDGWKFRKCSKINDNRMKKRRKPCFS